MKVIKAKTAGFCFGVRRAVDTVYKQVSSRKAGRADLYLRSDHTQRRGHKGLEAKGVKVLRSEEELNSLSGGTVIIRSHGVEKRIYDILDGKNVKIVDATCPFVKKIHNIVQEQSGAGDSL